MFIKNLLILQFVHVHVYFVYRLHALYVAHFKKCIAEEEQSITELERKIKEMEATINSQRKDMGGWVYTHACSYTVTHTHTVIFVQAYTHTHTHTHTHTQGPDESDTTHNSSETDQSERKQTRQGSGTFQQCSSYQHQASYHDRPSETREERLWRHAQETTEGRYMYASVNNVLYIYIHCIRCIQHIHGWILF